MSAEPRSFEVDVAVVGAGFAGLYLLQRLRRLGYSARAFESADDVGGTWYWNRYPGARCDIQSIDYSYTFDPDLDAEWQWSEKYAAQPEILRYLQHVADRYDLRPDIEFSTRIEAAVWDEGEARWRLTTSRGDMVSCQFYVMATGCLSVPKEIDVPGVERFAGRTYLTSRWPHDGVDFTGRRVAVIGTGSSAIQSIPIIAGQAAELVVFQRTPNFSIPANNGPIPESKLAAVGADRAAYRDSAKWSIAGVPIEMPTQSALAVSDEERLATYEYQWEHGGIIEVLWSYLDHGASVEANEKLCEFFRNKIRAKVHDPVTAELLCPTTFPIGTKRMCVDSGYYETFNLPHVRLVDLRTHPIDSVTESGIDLVDESLTFDDIVLATGFDAMTGAMVAVDITGRDGLTLAEAWAQGPQTYLGLMAHGFPNLFMVTGPGSPSVLSNMVVSIEQHVEWITDCLEHLRDNGFREIEPTVTAEQGWVQHGSDYADISLMDLANSWYVGANVPGKPRVVLPYLGGVERYRRVCNKVIDHDWLGLERRGPAGSVCNDGVVCRLQPDVKIMLEVMGSLGLPAMEAMSPAEARAFTEAGQAMAPPGPAVGEVVDGTLPGADGDLEYRLYRPATEGPHPMVVYFHGGGWVFGSHTSDDALCRDLCNQADVVIVSVNYRHAPEHRFPAAPTDAIAATRWVADHAAELGGVPGQVAVAGWSAGGNLAAVVAQHARDHGGPAIAGQLLLTPATDSDMTRPSYAENGEGYSLTLPLMHWFWDHYADAAERSSALASPLRAESLAGLPAACIVTGEFDPLRDEGDAYAETLAAAGVPVRHIQARGHIHTSITAVGALPSGAPVRAQMAEALRSFFA